MKNFFELIGVSWPGFLLALALTILVHFVHLSTQVENFFVDPLYLAFFIGLFVRWMIGEKFIFWPGFALTQDLFIPIGILLYATQVRWETLSLSSLQPFLIPLVFALLVYYLILVSPARKFKIRKEGSLLIWAASGLLGPLAVVLLSPALEASDIEASFALILAFFVTTAMLIVSPFLLSRYPVQPLVLGTLSMLSLPMLSPVNSITHNFPGAIAAAGLVFGIKVALLAPVALGIYMSNKARKKESGRFPLFLILGFFAIGLIFSFVPTLWYVRDNYEPAAKFLLTLALMGVGLSTDLRAILFERTKTLFIYLLLALAASAAVCLTGLWSLNLLQG